MINIAILGYGVVGSGVAEVIRMNRQSIAEKLGQEIFIKKILEIREFPNDPLHKRFTKNPDDVFLDPDIDVIVETIGGVTIAYEFTKRSLQAGKSVVTSNKELVATYGSELLKIAQNNRISYLFEASVGGGIPIIRPLNKCLSANRVSSIYGILNGTTNYILTKMSKDKVSFEKALSEAQALGFAETDPSSDIDGTDACRKIAILSSISTGEYVDYHLIHTEGIRKISDRDILYADRLGYKIKLLAVSRLDPDNHLEIYVAPSFISKESPLSVADGEYNAILIDGNALGPAMFYGKGAGKMPTASAVVADVIEAILHLHLKPHTIRWDHPRDIKILKYGDCAMKAFIRLEDGDDARVVLDQLELHTDVTYLQKEFLGEIAVLIGKTRPVSVNRVVSILAHSVCCLSVIRVL
jgi:homoserine dehydrogenase